MGDRILTLRALFGMREFKHLQQLAVVLMIEHLFLDVQYVNCLVACVNSTAWFVWCSDHSRRR